MKRSWFNVRRMNFDWRIFWGEESCDLHSVDVACTCAVKSMTKTQSRDSFIQLTGCTPHRSGSLPFYSCRLLLLLEFFFFMKWMFTGLRLWNRSLLPIRSRSLAILRDSLGSSRADDPNRSISAWNSQKSRGNPQKKKKKKKRKSIPEDLWINLHVNYV